MKPIAIGLLCVASRFGAAQGARGIVVFEEHCAQCRLARRVER